MLEFVKKDSKGNDLNVRISSKHPYRSEKDKNEVHCFIYRTFEWKDKKRKHWWNLFKTEEVVENCEKVLFNESTNVSSVLDWTKEMFEGWAEGVVTRYEQQLLNWSKEAEIRKLIDE